MQSRLNFLLVAAALLSLVAFQVAAQTRPARLDGEIVSIQGHTLRIKARSGEISAVTLAETVRVVKRVPLDLDQLKPGLFLGTTAKPQADGTLIASEVHVFPESARGNNAGHYPSDSEPRSTMTNATIKEVKAGSTTNATVADVGAAHDSRRMTLTYPGGEKTLIVPADVPVVLSEPADRSALKSGEHAVAYVTRGDDGSLMSERISVGSNGSVPPL